MIILEESQQNNLTYDLYVACRENSKKEVIDTLENLQFDPNHQVNCGGSGLHTVCENGNTDILKIFLEDERIDFNLATDDGWTPFHLACLHGHTSIIRLLLEDGRADPNKGLECRWNYLSSDPWAPIHTVCSNDIIKEYNLGKFYRHNAVDRLPILKLLLEDERVNINVLTDERESPLHIACKNKNINAIKLLLETNRCDVNEINDYDETPFFCFCRHFDIDNQIGKDILQILLADERINVNMSNFDNNRPRRTALECACEGKCIVLIKLLLSNRSDVIIPHPGNKYGDEIDKILNEYR